MSNAEDAAKDALVVRHRLEYESLVAGIEDAEREQSAAETAEGKDEAVADTKKTQKKSAADAKKANSDKGDATLVEEEQKK